MVSTHILKEEDMSETNDLEQNLQALLVQKHTIQSQLMDIENVLKEVEGTTDTVYKIVGSLMLKTTKENVVKELKEKKHVLTIRLGTVEKQEDTLQNELLKNREKT